MVSRTRTSRGYAALPVRTRRWRLPRPVGHANRHLVRAGQRGTVLISSLGRSFGMFDEEQRAYGIQVDGLFCRALRGGGDHPRCSPGADRWAPAETVARDVGTCVSEGGGRLCRPAEHASHGGERWLLTVLRAVPRSIDSRSFLIRDRARRHWRLGDLLARTPFKTFRPTYRFLLRAWGCQGCRVRTSKPETGRGRRRCFPTATAPTRRRGRPSVKLATDNFLRLLGASFFLVRPHSPRTEFHQRGSRRQRSGTEYEAVSHGKVASDEIGCTPASPGTASRGRGFDLFSRVLHAEETAA